MAALLTGLKPTLLLAPGRSRDRNGPVSPTLEGGAITVPGEHGRAWQVAEATTNYIPNPRFSPKYPHTIIPSGGAVSSFVDAGTGPDGTPTTFRLELQAGPSTGVSGRFLFQAPFITGLSSGAWTESVWVRTSNPDLVPMMYADVRDGAGIVGSMVTSTTSLGGEIGQWWRVVLTKSDWTRSPTIATLYLGVYPRTPGATGTVEFAGPQFEPKDYATPYADGSLGPGHAWTGVAHASASTRGHSSVRYDAMHNALADHEGTILIRYREPEQPHPGTGYLLTMGAWQNGFIGPARQDGNIETYIAPITPTTAVLTGSLAQPRIVGHTGLAITYDQAAIKTYLPTGAVKTRTNSGGAYVLRRPGAVGRIGYPSNQDANTAVESVLFFDRALTAEEVNALLTVPEAWDWSMFEPVPVTTPPARVPAVPATSGFRTGAIHQRPVSLLTIAGVPTKADTWTTKHGVDQPVGKLSTSIPLDQDLSHIQINAPVELHAGYEGEPTERIFLGRVEDLTRSASLDGKTIRLQCEDEASRFRYRLEDELVYPGQTTFGAIFQSLAALRGVQLFEAERVLYPNGAAEIALGGVPEIDGGDVTLRRRSSPLTWLTAKANLFGYRVFGKPSGAVELQRLAGQPSGEPVMTFVEGVDLIETEATRRRSEIITYWTVYGARYSDADGVPIELVAEPLTVPYDPLLDPPGYAPGDESDSDLVTQALVDAVRQVREIDYGVVSDTVTWTTWGRPHIQPGDVIAIVAPGVGLTTSSLRWVMSVTHSRTSRGFTTTITAWSGGGSPLPAGRVAEIIPIGAGPYRLGDEYLPHYVIPSGGGREQASVPFSVPKTYTSLALTGRQHGTNSYLLGGTSTESTVSKLEVWQNGERVGTAQLPMSPENLNEAYDYTNDAYWTGFRMAIPGKLEPGTAELRIISGRDTRADEGYRLDDFELKDLAIEARGASRPILPGVR